ncbi:MAG: L,D-transpeptidase family protein [Woeseiaceae bacterium]
MNLPAPGPVFLSRDARWRLLAATGVALVVVTYLAEGCFPGLFARDLPPADRVVVWKADRRLTLYSRDDAIATYSISLGTNPVGHKTWQGDSRTPEGLYTLDYRNPDSQFYHAIHVSYPDEDDLAAAIEADVPAGGDIMIHGLPNGRGWIGPLYKLRDWTDGCISVTNREMEEIWRAVPDGTPIEINP